MKKILLLFIGIAFSTSVFSQELDYTTVKKLFEKSRKKFDKSKMDSIIKYNLNDKKREILALPYKQFNSKKPHIGTYLPKKLNTINNYPKSERSDVSLLYRTRDIFKSNHFFPSSAVTKIVKYSNGKETGGCTATFIDERFLITATHCVLNTENKNPDEIKVKILYDNDKYSKEIKVKNIYYNKDYNPISLDFDCYDIALLEIDEPLGKELGYIGILSDEENDKSLNENRTFYNFSYPHMSFAEKLEEKLNTENDSIKNKTLLEIEKINYYTPDFSKTNQYFRIGTFLIDDSNALIYQIPYALAGQSGSAWVSENYYFYGVVSAWIEQFGNRDFDCRLRKEVLSSFIQIIEDRE